MKKILSGLALIVFCTTTMTVQAKTFNRYEIKSGIVEYTISGSHSGTETLYFDNNGKNEARYSEMTVSMMGFKSTSQNLFLIDGDWMYTIDLKEKEGTKMNIATAQDLAMKGMQNQTLQDFGKEAIQKMGGVEEGTETILGKKCKVYSFPKQNMKAWVYKNVLLKSTASMAGIEVIYTATNFQENVAVPKNKFSVPTDITITDAPAMPGNFDMNSMFNGEDETEMEDAQDIPEESVEETNSKVKKAFGLFKSMME